jgi:hypothetical protein
MIGSHMVAVPMRRTHLPILDTDYQSRCKGLQDQRKMFCAMLGYIYVTSTLSLSDLVAFRPNVFSQGPKTEEGKDSDLTIAKQKFACQFLAQV